MALRSLILLAFLANFESQALTLDEAFKAALSKSEVAGQSHESVVQAEERLSQAKGAIFPTLSFEASHLVQPEPNDPIAREFSPEKQTTANFSLTQPLFRGLREFAGVRQRKKSLSAAEQTRMATLLDLYNSVAASYLDILSLQQDLKNLNGQKKIYGERVKELQQRIRRGESSASEALTAQSTEAVLDAEIRITETRLVNARENFKFLTSLPSDSVLEDLPATTRNDLPKLKPLQAYIDQIEKRPDVISARESAQAAREEIRIARGGHWPQLDLTGNYYVKRPSGYLSDIHWDLQLKLTLPLFEGGIVMSQTREAASKSRVQELELSRLRRQAESEITSLYEGLRNRVDQLTALRRASELSEKNYQVLQRDFRRGLTRSVDVQLALTEFRVARRGYDQARYAARLDWIRLQLASAQFPESLVKEF